MGRKYMGVVKLSKHQIENRKNEGVARFFMNVKRRTRNVRCIFAVKSISEAREKHYTLMVYFRSLYRNTVSIFYPALKEGD
ncbi:hypothetical protein [Bacillus sp. MUM 13]|uniref:hypothetical protein n=1 Tax=Bacillus sp. MUM 13 TaxID=1678001 RepID=UPI0008F5CC76|nr:hypothetical protein [Bacillus sp. MUM 13]OIK09313.1 hypothetical protein BIV59_17340 [Bacillus sp. MUM 13]